MSSGRAKYDPLEAAKLAAEGGPAAPKTQAPAAKEAAAPSEVKTPSSAPTAPMAPATAAAPSKKIKYRVVQDKRVSVSGMLCDWKAGRVIDPAGYGGDAGIQRLKDQGLILEQIEE